MPHPIRAAWFTRPGWSAFGGYRPPPTPDNSHRGFDYYCPEGTPIYGTGPGGRVSSIGYNPNRDSGLGHNLTIVYPDARVTLDAHMRARTPLQIGSLVDEDTVVGYVGQTGNAFGIVWNGMVHDHHQVWSHGVLVDPVAFYNRLELAAGDVEPISASRITKGDDMLVYANSDTNLWAAGVPFGGIWQGIPSGQGAAFVKASGRELIVVSGAEFDTIAAICRQKGTTDTRVYADPATDQWFVIGPGVFYPVPAGRGSLFESIYGSRIVMSGTDIEQLRLAFQAMPSASTDRAIIDAINALDIPTAAENGQAARDAIVR